MPQSFRFKFTHVLYFLALLTPICCNVGLVSIQQSVDATPSGGTLVLRGGFYSCGVVVTKPISIIGEEDDVFFDCLGQARAFSINLACESDSPVSFSGLTIIHGASQTASAVLATGVRVLELMNCTVADNTVQSNTTFWLYSDLSPLTSNQTLLGSVVMDSGDCGSDSVRLSLAGTIFKNNTVHASFAFGLAITSTYFYYFTLWRWNALFSAGLTGYSRSSSMTVSIEDCEFMSNDLRVDTVLLFNTTLHQITFAEPSVTDHSHIIASASLAILTTETDANSFAWSLSSSSFCNNEAAVQLHRDLRWVFPVAVASSVAVVNKAIAPNCALRSVTSNCSFRNGSAILLDGSFEGIGSHNLSVSVASVLFWELAPRTDLNFTQHLYTTVYDNFTDCQWSANTVQVTAPSSSGFLVVSGGLARAIDWAVSPDNFGDSNSVYINSSLAVNACSFRNNAVSVTSQAALGVLSGGLALKLPQMPRLFIVFQTNTTVISVVLSNLICFANTLTYNITSLGPDDTMETTSIVGAAVALNSSKFVSLIAGNFSANKASLSGTFRHRSWVAAAVCFAYAGPFVSVLFNSFSNNSALASGIIYEGYSHAVAVSGAFLLVPFYLTDASISHSTMISNSVNVSAVPLRAFYSHFPLCVSGGIAVLLDSVFGYMLILHNNTISDSGVLVERLGLATNFIVAGGAVSIFDSMEAVGVLWSISNSLFTRNTALVNAGLLNVVGSAVAVCALAVCQLTLEMSYVALNSGTTGGSESGAMGTVAVYQGSSGQSVTCSVGDVILHFVSFSGHTQTQSAGFTFVTTSPSQSPLTISNSQFSYNLGATLGGGILMKGPALVSVTNCTFKNNSASSGGAIYLSTGSTMTVTNSSFYGNYANSAGGAIFSESDSSLSISNCSFVDDDSAFGSSLALVGSVTITDSTFTFAEQSNAVVSFVNLSTSSFIDSTLQCAPGSEFVFGQNQLMCRPCSPGSFSFVGSSLPLTHVCQHCPDNGLGLNCSLGGTDVGVREGYWATSYYETPTSSLPRLWVMGCPPSSGCCTRPTCDLGDQCIETREGTLCAGCQPGTVISLQSSQCIPEHLCGTMFSVLGVLLMVVACGVFVCVLLRDARKQSSQYGILACVSYYYQIAPLVMRVDTHNQSMQGGLALSSLLTSIFSLHFSPSSTPNPAWAGLWCPSKHLTALGAVVFSYVLPAVLFAWLVFLVLALVLWRRRAPPTTTLAEPLVVNAGGDEDATSGPSYSSEHTPTPLSSPYIVWTVVWKLLGFTYNTVLLTTLTLLDCVDVPDPDRPGQLKQVIFQAATSQCWTPLQYFLAVVVCPLLLAYPLVVLYLLRYHSRSQHAWNAGLRQTLAPYRYQWWLVLILLRRLVLVVVFVFVTNPILQSWVLSLLCSAFLVVHVWVRPMVFLSSTILDAVLLSALTLLSIQSVALAVFAQLGQYPSGVGLFAVFSQILILLPVLFGVVLASYNTLRARYLRKEFPFHRLERLR